MKKILYISYDGMTDPLGQSQVLSYLRPLSKRGYAFTVLSYEKPGRFSESGKETADSLKGYDIEWVPLPYTRRPPVLSTLRDLREGKRKIRELFEKGKPDLVHCRGYIASLLGLYCRKKYGTKFIFDMRGWWADEKLESGNWNGPVYRVIYNYFKRKEKKFFSGSAHAVSLTNTGKAYIIKQGWCKDEHVSVIPTCVDFDLFKPFSTAVRETVRKELKIPLQNTVLLYSGSMGGNYRDDLVFRIFNTQLKKDPASTLLLLTPTPPGELEHLFVKFGADRDKVVIRSCRFTEVGRYLMAGDIGLVFYDQRFSALGRSPTKLGEYWASGLPFISVTGIGDLEKLHEKYPQASALLHTFTENEFEHALAALREHDPGKLRQIALENFDLTKGVELYSTAYQRCLAH